MKTSFSRPQTIECGQSPKIANHSGIYRIIALVICTVYVLSGCSSSEKAVRSTNTAIAPGWFKAAQVKAEKLNYYLKLQAPADVKNKRVAIVHPDSTVKDSGSVYIGDIAEVAYLAKVVNVYTRMAAQDAAKAYLQGVSLPENPEQDPWYLQQADTLASNLAPKAAQRLDSLSKAGNATFDKLEEQVRNLVSTPTLTDKDEIQLFGLLEKLNVLAKTNQDMIVTASADGTARLWKSGLDSDGDGILDTRDNCPSVPNSNQADRDGDGVEQNTRLVLAE
ncbi:MAG: hypothetical protein HGB11_13615 [Chlorobiales bacterium]|nr:hypothetical protein [Chlorobiales bacterium]